MADTKVQDDAWTLWWDARVAAMENVLGKSADTVGHGVIPFPFGPEMGAQPTLFTSTITLMASSPPRQN